MRRAFHTIPIPRKLGLQRDKGSFPLAEFACRAEDDGRQNPDRIRGDSSRSRVDWTFALRCPDYFFPLSASLLRDRDRHNEAKPAKIGTCAEYLCWLVQPPFVRVRRRSIR